MSYRRCLTIARDDVAWRCGMWDVEMTMESLGYVFEAVSGYFALLSEPMRVRILHSLCRDERTVSEIVAQTGGTQTNVSRHLNTMYRAGALNRRKQGNFTYYSVRDSVLTEICRTVCTHIAGRGDPLVDERLEIRMFADQFAPAAAASAPVPASRRRRAPVPASPKPRRAAARTGATQ